MLALAAAPLPAAERSYSVTDFEKIRLTGPHKVTVTQGRARTARAIGDQVELQALKLDVAGGQLQISSASSAVSTWRKRDRPALEILITTPRLTSGQVLGAGTLTIDRLAGQKVEAGVAGAGKLSIGRIDADRTSLRLVGDGSIVAGGRTLALEVDARGSGSLDASKLAAKDVKLSTASSGSVKLQATKTVTGLASGAGSTEVDGKAVCTLRNLGSGTVVCGE